MIKNAAVAVAVIVLSSCARDEQNAAARQGTIELHERQLGFELAGRLRELSVHRGERVEAGQVLAVLDDGLERPQRDARSEEVRAAQAQLDLLRAGSRREEVRATEAQLRAARAGE